MAKKQHPAALESKRLIQNALMETLRYKGFQDITVSEICDKANVSRRTFYRHYKNTVEVLEKASSMIIDGFSKALEARNNHCERAFLLGYFEFWELHKEMLIILSKNNLIHLLFMPGMLAFAKFQQSNLDDIQLIFDYGGLWSVLTFWLNSPGLKLKPTDIVDNLLAGSKIIENRSCLQ